MVAKLFVAWGVMALCVVIHAIGVTSAVDWLRSSSSGPQLFWRSTWMFIRLAGWMVLLHLIEITMWALLYVRQDAMPDLASALYFSAVTYTTTGYGDLVLPEVWRLVGAIEALTGILMCGWSTGFFFAVVARMFQAETAQVHS
jgi:Ion channel